MNSFSLTAGAMALLSGLALVGCNQETKPTATVVQGTLVTYQCEDGTTFSARLSDQEAVADLPNNPNLALPQVESGSGAKYSDGTTTLWDKGGEAFVESNGEIILANCQATQPAAGGMAPPAEPASTNAAQNSQQANTAPDQNSQPAAAPTSNSGSGIRTQRVQFQPGTSSSTVEGSVTGYEGVDYVLNARAGQVMNVSMATDNSSNYFNIIPPGETDVALFNSSSQGNQFEGELPASGDYKIRVYLMRNAARENQTGNYRLEMIVSGGGNTASSSGSASSQPKAAGTGYNATGNIPCSMTQAEANESCTFGVIRQGNGNAVVDITTPSGRAFSIYFENGDAYKVEGGLGEFSRTRQGDETLVYVGQERYIIPDAVIFGG
jgi:membrane-bound inhibitor of C-type lysozyme